MGGSTREGAAGARVAPHLALPAGDDRGLLVVPVLDGACELRRVVRLDADRRRRFEELVAGAGETEPRADAAFLAELERHGLCDSFGGGELGPWTHGRSPLGGAELLRVARAVLDAGHRLRLLIHGRSMRPWIGPGDRVEVERLAPRDFRPGHVALYSTPAHPLVMHRVIAVDEVGLVTRGDASKRRDQVPAAEVLGRVVRRARPGAGPEAWRPVGGWPRPIAPLACALWRAGARAVGRLSLRA